MVKIIKIGEEDKETKVAENVTKEPAIDEEPASTELDLSLIHI